MIINFDEHNITCDYYAYVKAGTVRKGTLLRANSRLPFVVVGLGYMVQKPFYDMAVRRVAKKALSVFNIYGHGDVRMTTLLSACRQYGLRLEEFLCPDELLKLDDIAKKVDLVVLDYLENKVLEDVANILNSDDELSSDAQTEATESIQQFAALAAAEINTIITIAKDDVQAIEEPRRYFRESDLRSAVGQLNAYSSSLMQLTSAPKPPA